MNAIFFSLCVNSIKIKFSPIWDLLKGAKEWEISVFILFNTNFRKKKFNQFFLNLKGGNRSRPI